MDPLSLASAFATIIGLIGQFRGEKAGKEQTDYNEFLQWLIESNHKEIQGLLQTNSQAAQGIEEILKEDRALFLEKIESINNALVSYSSHLSGFSSLASGLSKNSGLSDQAASILIQFEKQEASKVLQVPMYGGPMLMFMDGNQGDVDVQEPRFIEDDLKKLIELGLLRHDFNSKGENLYIITRAASELTKTIITSS